MADYTAILTAIDAAILAGITKPGSMSVMGEQITYRNLTELKEIREYYAQRHNLSGTVRSRIKFGKFKPGAPV